MKTSVKKVNKNPSWSDMFLSSAWTADYCSLDSSAWVGPVLQARANIWIYDSVSLYSVLKNLTVFFPTPCWQHFTKIFSAAFTIIYFHKNCSSGKSVFVQPILLHLSFNIPKSSLSVRLWREKPFSQTFKYSQAGSTSNINRFSVHLPGSIYFSQTYNSTNNPLKLTMMASE